MTWAVRALMVVAGTAALVVLASPAGAAPPAAPAAPCLPDGSCPVVPATVPCAPVGGVDPCPPCTDLPTCLIQFPDLPVDVPRLSDTTAVPLPDVVPALPTDTPAEAVPAAAPVPAPDVTDRESTSSEGGGSGTAPSSGGDSAPRPATLDTASTSSRPAAVAHAARSFSLLFALAGLVGGYLLVQGRLDARDPKLAAAPIDRDDELVSFR